MCRRFFFFFFNLTWIINQFIRADTHWQIDLRSTGTLIMLRKVWLWNILFKLADIEWSALTVRLSMLQILGRRVLLKLVLILRHSIVDSSMDGWNRERRSAIRCLIIGGHTYISDDWITTSQSCGMLWWIQNFYNLRDLTSICFIIRICSCLSPYYAWVMISNWLC